MIVKSEQTHQENAFNMSERSGDGFVLIGSYNPSQEVGRYTASRLKPKQEQDLTFE